jgi:glucosamine-6-phosphate deaminase
LKVFAAGSRAAAARRAAEAIAAVLRRPGSPVLVLSTGQTMVPIYRELARLHRTGRAPFARAVTFNVDELCVPAQDPRSFRAFMERHLFRKVRLARRRIHLLAGDAPDARRECERIERELALAGGADLVLLGIGINGHIAYLEPARALPPRTARVRLSASTRRGLAAAGVRPVPREALTMGLETILSARQILLVATGKSKAKIVARALHGRVSPKCPASYLSLHPRLTVVLDRNAAALL